MGRLGQGCVCVCVGPGKRVCLCMCVAGGPGMMVCMCPDVSEASLLTLWFSYVWYVCDYIIIAF